MKKSRLNWFYASLLLLSVSAGYAQNKTLTGVVSDDGSPLPGVSVTIKGTQHGTQTDLDGKYTLNVKQGDVLVFSFIGMQEATYKVGTVNTYNVSLSTADNILDELVVLAYGQVKKKNEVTGNAVTVKGETIAQTPVTSVDQALMGRVAGLQISGTSGSPGATQNIRIRGRNSVSATNEPLYVIDGVPVVNSNLSNSTAVTSISPLAAMNSEDIETITVLKDAATTAVYGARGSNGVILITTKKGRQGKPSYNLKTSIGFQNRAVKGPRMLNGEEKAELWLEALGNTLGKDSEYVLANYQGIMGNDLFYYWHKSGRPYSDWDKEVKVKDAPMTSLSFSVNGGDEKGTYFASIGHDKTDGIVLGTDFRRVSGNFSFTRKLSDKIDIKIGANVSNIKQNGIFEGDAYFSNPNLTRRFMNPWAMPYDENGDVNINPLFLGGLPNTLYVLKNDLTQNDLTRVISSNTFGYKILSNLKFESTIGLDYTLVNYKGYQNPVHGDGKVVGGSASQTDRRAFNYVWQNSLNYNFYLGEKHGFDFRALMEFQKFKYNMLNGSGEVLPPGLSSLGSAAANHNAQSNYYDWAQLSYLGIMNYSYDNRYLLDLTVRREGSSRFSEDERWGTFWAVGAAWNINEDFFKDSSVVNTLRLRGSIGSTGNSSINANSFQHLLSAGSYNNEAALVTSQVGGKLGWEKQFKSDIGVEFGLFNNRVSGSFAFYKSKTKDLLYSLPLSITTGFSSKWINQGELENKGFEAELNVAIFDTPDFKWSIGGNVGFVKDKLTKMNPVIKSYNADMEGHKISEWYMPEFAGVDPETGDALWYNLDGTKTKVYDAKTQSKFQGASALPKLTGGVNTHIEFKGFYADALFTFATGYKVYDLWSQITQAPNASSLYSYNGDVELLGRWRKPGDITDVPRLTYNQGGSYVSPNTRFLYDGDHIRLRQLTVGYNFNKQAVKTLGLDAVNISVSALNPFTWVKDKRLKFDPEVDATGYIELTSPALKSVVFSLNVKF